MTPFDTAFKDVLREGTSLLFERLPSSSLKAWLIAKLYAESGKNILVITGEGAEETKLKDDISFFTSTSLIELPSWETLPTERTLPSREIIGARQKALKKIRDHKQTSSSSKGSSLTDSLFVISSLQATLQWLPSQKVLDEGHLFIKVGLHLSYNTAIERLQKLGYERAALTTEKGQFSVRGGILDVFSVIHEKPCRIEFFGDEIDSLRYFDPVTQKAIEEIPSLEIVHALEHINPKAFNLEGDGKDSIFTLLGAESTLVVLDDIEKVEDRYATLLGIEGGNADFRKSAHPMLMSLREWLHSLQKMSSWCMMTSREIEELSQEVSYKEKRIKGASRYGDFTPVPLSFSLFDEMWSGVRLHHPLKNLGEFYMEECFYDAPPQGEMFLDAYTQVIDSTQHTFVVQSDIEREWIQTKLHERGAHLDKAQVTYGYLSSGVSRSDTKEVFLPMSELTGRVKIKRSGAADVKGEGRSHLSSVTAQAPVTGFDAYELQPGDSVVHFHHGIGKFLGIEKRPNAQGVVQEFFLIEYAESAKLFVPIHQAHLITKYIGAHEEAPKLHILGASRWKKLREETEKAIVGYASELLKAQAKREIAGGFSYRSDGPKMILFEAEFPYEETEDQLKAIEEIKADMCSKKAMDRLVCGDVGYGKTEVAMRAAFKAVVDGQKQVAVLVPTTVLAMQHYENFIERMTPFGIRIGILSRFQTIKQNRETTLKVASGEIDIIVGTHKLLQKGLSFKDLGLVIIDEEQRFGVKAKEHLKILKEGVDCLTLSATPIPRTLYMSLVGAKALSTIATPPYDRLPIKTVVAEFDQNLVQSAILRELNRGGQVFYIHNRVETIFDACDRVKKLVPRARITPVHGQMDSDDIDLVFHAFKRGEIDVLVATSIVENGIDIPNANTIIVERADQFGIAELYQLRGRVGRSNKRAFAYFLIPSNRSLSEIARRRIDAIARSGGFGGGLKVAMRDLEIRGAGDILGIDQSGHVASIGFHLYCKLLKRTVDSLQGKKVFSPYDTKIEVPFIAKLPEEYVNEVELRVELYQRLGESESVERVEEIKQEIIDRFGKMPLEAEWLIALSKVRSFAASKGVSLLKLEGHSVTIERKQGTQLVTQHALVTKMKTPQEFYEKMVALLSSK